MFNLLHVASHHASPMLYSLSALSLSARYLQNYLKGTSFVEWAQRKQLLLNVSYSNTFFFFDPLLIYFFIEVIKDYHLVRIYYV